MADGPDTFLGFPVEYVDMPELEAAREALQTMFIRPTIKARLTGGPLDGAVVDVETGHGGLAPMFMHCRFRGNVLGTYDYASYTDMPVYVWQP